MIGPSAIGIAPYTKSGSLPTRVLWLCQMLLHSVQRLVLLLVFSYRPPLFELPPTTGLHLGILLHCLGVTL